MTRNGKIRGWRGGAWNGLNRRWPDQPGGVSVACGWCFPVPDVFGGTGLREDATARQTPRVPRDRAGIKLNQTKSNHFFVEPSSGRRAVPGGGSYSVAVSQTSNGQDLRDGQDGGWPSLGYPRFGPVILGQTNLIWAYADRHGRTWTWTVNRVVGGRTRSNLLDSSPRPSPRSRRRGRRSAWSHLVAPSRTWAGGSGRKSHAEARRRGCCCGGGGYGFGVGEFGPVQIRGWSNLVKLRFRENWTGFTGWTGCRMARIWGGRSRSKDGRTAAQPPSGLGNISRGQVSQGGAALCPGLSCASLSGLPTWGSGSNYPWLVAFSRSWAEEGLTRRRGGADVVVLEVDMGLGRVCLARSGVVVGQSWSQLVKAVRHGLTRTNMDEHGRTWNLWTAWTVWTGNGQGESWLVAPSRTWSQLDGSGGAAAHADTRRRGCYCVGGGYGFGAGALGRSGVVVGQSWSQLVKLRLWELDRIYRMDKMGVAEAWFSGIRGQGWSRWSKGSYRTYGTNRTNVGALNRVKNKI